MQFRTTKTFLRSFGLTKLDDLPELSTATKEGAQLTMELERYTQRLQAAEVQKDIGETGEAL